MLVQVLFTFCIMLTAIQTVMDLKDYHIRNLNKFHVDPAELTSSKCTVKEPLQRLNHFLFQTCPTTFDSICNDPLYNKPHEIEFRCSFSMWSNSVISMNSSGFMELLKIRDPYARDWCMIVIFYSPSCPFSARLAPHFNDIAGKFKNILPIAIDASDFQRSHRLNFRYGVSATPNVLLWVNGMGVARMGNKNLDLQSIKSLITSHTDLVEIKDEVKRENKIPEKVFEHGAELKKLSVDFSENQFINGMYTFACLLVCVATFIYHVRERILLSTPVLQWFQSKCGGPLCEDIYFLFYVAAPRNRNIPAAQAHIPEQEAAAEVVAEAIPVNAELPPLVIEDQ